MREDTKYNLPLETLEDVAGSPLHPELWYIFLEGSKVYHDKIQLLKLIFECYYLLKCNNLLYFSDFYHSV